MSIFVIPALLALMLKLMVVFVYRQNIKANNSFTVMVLVFACHNLCEVLVFWEYFRGIKADYLLKTYYVISLLSLFVITLNVAQISGQKERLFAKFSVPILVLVSLGLMCTGLLVDGSKSWGYVVTAIRGDFYWVFQLTAMVLTVQMSYLLYRGYIEAQSHQSQIQCVFTGLALLPQILAVFLVIALMNAGIKINGAMIFPLATTMFLGIFLASENYHKMTDIRRFIPFSDERRTSNQIMDIFSDYAKDEATYREAITEIEKLLVEHKYEKNGRNATYAAERMGMPRSSLYSLFNRLGIKKEGS